MSASPEDGRPAPRHSGAGSRLLVLLGLTGFAISQPLLALLGEEPAFFVFRRASGSAIVVLALSLAIGPALALWVLTSVIGKLHDRAGRITYLLVVGALVALTVHPLLRQAGLEAPPAQLLVAGGLAVGFTIAFVRVGLVAQWARFTAVLPPLALATFLLVSPAGDLLGAADEVATDSASSDLPSVVLLVLDEFSTASMIDDDRQIDARRFPNLARFAEDATWYRNYTGIATGTQQAIPSMLSSMLPRNAEPILADHPQNLFTLLAPTHELEVSESMTALCAFAQCSTIEGPGWWEQVATLRRDVFEIWTERIGLGPPAAPDLADFAEVVDGSADGAAPTVDFTTGTEAPTRFSELLATIEPTETPTLWFQHLILPHRPWRHFPDGTRYARVTDDAFMWERPWTVTVEQQRYLLQAQYTDRLIGQLLDRLQTTGLYDDSLVIVVADHGVAFEPGENSRLWSDTTISEVAFAPLLIKPPGATEGGISDENVMGHDLTDTVADLLGIEIPWETDGAPASSEEVRSRGKEKLMYDFGSLLAPTSGTVGRFNLDEHLPDARARWLRTLRPGEDDLAALHDAGGVLPWVGLPLDPLLTDHAGTVEVDDLEQIERTGTRGQMAMISGEVVDGPAGEGRLLVAVDGVVVAGSPVIDVDGHQRFYALMPKSAVTQPERALRFAWVAGAGEDVVELTIRR